MPSRRLSPGGRAAALLLTGLLMGCAVSPAGHKTDITSPGAPSRPEASPAPLVVIPFGLCEDYPEESRSLDEVRRDIQVLKRAGVTVLRVSIGWDGVEPERDHY